MAQQIEAVFENGVFRPLQPVNLPEHQRVILQVPNTPETEADSPVHAQPTPAAACAEEEFDEAVAYNPIPLRACRMIKVKYRNIGKLPPVPYHLDEDELEALDERE
jgi:predicted DNA-binding antitoxin AbrB/MazE fold protein